MKPLTRPRDLSVSAGLIIVTFVLQLFFFAPIQVLAQNFGEFSIDFSDALIALVGLSLILTGLLLIIVKFTRSKAFLVVLTFLSTIIFLESRWLLNIAAHDPFNGKPIDWSALAWLSYLELGIIMLLGGLFYVLRKRAQVFSNLSLFMLLFLIAGFINTSYLNYKILLPANAVASTSDFYLDNFYKLSNKRNVIHIVPDQAQGALVHDILTTKGTHYSDVFDGFTLYTQAVGRYKSTYPSVPFYMSGEAPEPISDRVSVLPFTWEYVSKTLEETSVVTALSKSGFKTFGFQFHPGLFCKGPYTACTGTHDEVFAGVAVETQAQKFAFTIMSVLDLGLFQSSPIILREQVFNNGLWQLRNLISQVNTHSGVLDVFSSRLMVEESPGTYNYIHHAGAHAPLLFDRNCDYVGPQDVNIENQKEQLQCTLAQLEKLLVSLKQNNVYDQTMIVIHGDHGSPWLPASYPNRANETVSKGLMGNASSMLLVKPVNGRGPLSFSSKYVTLGDVPVTIADSLGIENSFSGVSVLNDDIEPGRERQFFTYDSASKAHQLQALKNAVRYRIRGDVFDAKSWVLPDTFEVVNNPSMLSVDNPQFAAFTQGFSFLEQHAGPVRWVDGDEARVILSATGQGGLNLVFDGYVPATIEGQSIEISIDGVFIANLDADQLKQKHHVVPLPSDLVRSNAMEIVFKMAVAQRSGNDSRRLSALFMYVGLEPVQP